jgi:hypothetical protein
MMDEKQALAELLRLMEPILGETKFSAVKLAAAESDIKTAAHFEGESGALRLEVYDDKAALLYSQLSVAEALEGDYARLALALLERETAEAREYASVAADFSEALQEKFTKPGKALTTQGKKVPKSVSKTAIKNGDAYYDPVSFANSFTGLFPELRAVYKENYERYGEFLCEEFFLQHGNAVVLQTIRQGDPVQMKRLFHLLNEVYENGVNDVQSLITVTILGALENDETLLARCVDYMSPDLTPVMIHVNKYLASRAGKTARQRLDHPPAYKPKKKKKSGILQQLMGGEGMPGI